jgi:hypothetical protein
MRHGYSGHVDAQPREGQSYKRLPANSCWLFCNDLPVDTQDTEVQEFLAACGIDLELDYIVVKPGHGHMASAMIGLPPAWIACLVNWAINKKRLRGKSVVEFGAPRQKGR